MHNSILIQSDPKAIFLIGPTASQKTSISFLLYRYLKNIEIISVDSGLIYRGMNIGTAKPNPQELSDIPHRLIDILDPSECYSAANFRHDALEEMNKITKNGNIPLLVGGTFFYFKALLDGLSPLPAADKEVRKFIKKKEEVLGKRGLYEYLQKIDPISANRIHINDFTRLSRALEVFFISGKTLTELITISGEPLPYRVYSFAIQSAMNHQLQYQRIENRFYAMLKSGLKEEVSHLLSRGDLHIEMPSIRCIGYRQMWLYLSQNISYNDMVLQVIDATKQLYKRQRTWLKKWSSLHWLDDSQSAEEIADTVKKIIQNP